MKYEALPVIVDAFVIVETNMAKYLMGADLVLDNGETVYADRNMCARMVPKPGDYYVTQSDGYVYLNPKEVFERKYKKTETEEQK